jgi:hypothetical protein
LKLAKLLQNNQMQKSEKNSDWELALFLDASYDWAFQFCMNIGASTYKDDDLHRWRSNTTPWHWQVTYRVKHLIIIILVLRYRQRWG